MKNIFKHIRVSIHKYLERMAKENEKEFGRGRLDCCHLNENPNFKNKKILHKH